ncbi:MAG: dihydropteroate synthase [Anaerophaga sp.]|uniref:dihydropteroate synthase n=1 Tax=Anaerophaga thermohalophila TaxID=177400 RepID=UPI000237BB0F|nr:dihydropteroate synthase [Anaerophaga thermohalophila]MDI3521467.1 dihydropteroate synthase [Anaerophaga sp.]MDK2842983.1 dihydropteroate synthase [Anaerophaga sp.]MDN5292392.1 dihydropteroate synthase [Anaerophaga sp.]
MKNFEVEDRFLTPALSINCRGRLVDLSEPVVMGIVNVTPDSFYEGSRVTSLDKVLARVEQILDEGGRMVDIGACSTRPGADDVSEEEEGNRLWPVLKAIRNRWPDILLSVDTFRGKIAQKAVNDYGVDIINDISAGMLDASMFEIVAGLNVPYVLMHMKGTPGNMQNNPVYSDVTGEVILFLAEKVDQLRALGVSDIIIDPGFGFGKNIEHNFRLLNELEQFKMFEFPLLVGLSRKSMIYKHLDGTPDNSLNGTTVLNTLALSRGANILRVHDVKEAVECVKLVSKTIKRDLYDIS